MKRVTISLKLSVLLAVLLAASIGFTALRVPLIQAAVPDFDLDGVADVKDNCPVHFNPGQEDRNGNGVGNACDNARDQKELFNQAVRCYDTSGAPVITPGCHVALEIRTNGISLRDCDIEEPSDPTVCDLLIQPFAGEILLLNPVEPDTSLDSFVLNSPEARGVAPGLFVTTDVVTVQDQTETTQSAVAFGDLDGDGTVDTATAFSLTTTPGGVMDIELFHGGTFGLGIIKHVVIPPLQDGWWYGVYFWYWKRWVEFGFGWFDWWDWWFQWYYFWYFEFFSASWPLQDP